jgi:OPT family oligopeptide transporter
MTASVRAPEAGPDVALSAELTPRAIGAGAGVGAVLAIGNVYMGLKTGWWDSGNITAAVLGFGLLAPSARRSGRPYSLFENNVTQTLAGSAAIMPGVLGLLGALPALELLDHHYATWAVGLWGIALALFGIFLAVPLRRRFVVSEPLPFPSAIATAEVIRAIHSSSDEARARTRTLLASAAVAMAFTWLRDGRPALFPTTIWIPAHVAGVAAESLTLGIAASPMLVSVGMLAGARSGLSLLGGSVLAWGVIAPALVRAGVARAEYTSLVSWLLWPGVAMMVASGLVGLVGQWRSFAKALSHVKELRSSPRDAVGWAPIFVLGAAVVLLTWVVFGVHPVAGALVVTVSVVLIDVCVRTAGETDIAPLGSIGQLVQLVLGVIAPGPAPVNVACASLAAGAGGQSSLTVNVLKAGHVLGAPLRGQLRAQVIGVFAGAIVALPAYTFIKSAHGIGNATFPVPAALGWKALADLAAKGTTTLPPWAAAACAFGAAVGVVLTLLERSPRVARFVPSPVALAAAFLVPASTGAAIGLGALVVIALQRRNPSLAERLTSSGAAGGIAGESLMGFVVAALIALGILPSG